VRALSAQRSRPADNLPTRSSATKALSHQRTTDCITASHRAKDVVVDDVLHQCGRHLHVCGCRQHQQEPDASLAARIDKAIHGFLRVRDATLTRSVARGRHTPSDGNQTATPVREVPKSTPSSGRAALTACEWRRNSSAGATTPRTARIGPLRSRTAPSMGSCFQHYTPPTSVMVGESSPVRLFCVFSRLMRLAMVLAAPRYRLRVAPRGTVRGGSVGHQQP
jgi:hypothetical protein